jgi:hypothetical protein
MRAARRALIVLICAIGFVPKSDAEEKFRAASGGFSTAIHALLWLAYEKKLFQKYGLDGEYLALESGTPAMQALLANELQIVFTTGALAISANLQGADTTIIAGGINFNPNKLLVRPDIKTPEGLKGKRIAISRFGSASDYATQVALEKTGNQSERRDHRSNRRQHDPLGGFESGHRPRDVVKRTAHDRWYERIQAQLADRSGRKRHGSKATGNLTTPRNSSVSTGSGWLARPMKSWRTWFDSSARIS